MENDLNELREKIDRVYALAQDNHKMLRAIRRTQWIAFFWKLLVWIVVLALPFVIYNEFIQPLLNGSAPHTGSLFSSLLNGSSSSHAQNLLKSLSGQ